MRSRWAASTAAAVNERTELEEVTALKLLRRLVVVSTVMTLGAVFLTATPAMAADYPRCNNIGNGEVCIVFVGPNNQTVEMSYRKWAGSPVTVRFSYQAGYFRRYDDGWFVASVRGAPYTFAWNGQNPGRCATGYLHVANGPTFSTGQNCYP